MNKKLLWVDHIDESGNPKRYKAGVENVVEINEHRPQDESDKWFYDVMFKNGDKLRMFTILNAYFIPDLSTFLLGKEVKNVEVR